MPNNMMKDAYHCSSVLELANKSREHRPWNIFATQTTLDHTRTVINDNSLDVFIIGHDKDCTFLHFQTRWLPVNICLLYVVNLLMVEKCDDAAWEDVTSARTVDKPRCDIRHCHGLVLLLPSTCSRMPWLPNAYLAQNFLQRPAELQWPPLRTMSGMVTNRTHFISTDRCFTGFPLNGTIRQKLSPL